MLFTEIADRVLALLAISAQSTMTHTGKFLPADAFTGQNPRQDEIKDGNFVKHAAGRESKDRNISYPAAEKHGPGSTGEP